MTPFIGQIIMFGGNFAIRSFALANGQLLAISSNTALFSLYGTIYGGDGRTTFALPDLRGRVPVHAGNGPGLPPINLGQKFGASSMILQVAHMPSHNHTAVLNVNSTAGDEDETNPASGVLSNNSNSDNYTSSAANAQYAGGSGITVGNTGGSQSFNLYQPSLAIYFEVALQGIFPSRN
jgi:microcystin-dependent protein